jgi:electron transport complex protein RnfD
VGLAIVGISWPVYVNYNLGAVNFPLNFNFHYPLTMLKSGGGSAIADLKLHDLFLGHQVGGIGSTPVYLLLLGGMYLLVRRTITWQIPVFFILGILTMAGLFRIFDPGGQADPLFHLFTGNAMIGAFFLATDFASAPYNRLGKMIFGFGCGVLTVIFRLWSVHVEGVIYAVLVMNLFTPLLDKIKKQTYLVPLLFLEGV